MRCPNGHESEATDYCDTCGAVMETAADPTTGGAATTAGAGAAGGGAGSVDPRHPPAGITAAAEAAAAGEPGAHGSVSAGATAAGNTVAAGEGAGSAPSTSGSPGAAPVSSLDLDVAGGAAATSAASSAGTRGPSGSFDQTGSLGAGGSSDAAGSTGDRPCPNCGAPNAPDALFCEACGYDHTTGSMPRRAPVGIPDAGEDSAAPPNASTALRTPWVAEIWIDPRWYANQGSPDPLPSQGPPVVVALRNASLLIGRVSVSRGIQPDIDCGVDNGVSRRHAQLTTDGTRWWIEDLDSSNGTYIGDAVGDLPTTAIPVGQKREVDADDRIYLGSWTRIVLRPSTDDEVAALS